RRMRYLFAVSLVLLAAAMNVNAADVYRWVDENGGVHYGDKVPDAMKQKAQPVDVAGGPTRDADRPAPEKPATEGWFARAKAMFARMTGKHEQAPAAKGVTITGPKPSAAPVQLTCAQEWERYERSGSCFDPYSPKHGVRGDTLD